MCDKSGSLNDAKCDPVTDVEQGLIAGRCHCKELVEGDNCEKCKNGYFNLTKENPIGCERNLKLKKIPILRFKKETKNNFHQYFKHVLVI